MNLRVTHCKCGERLPFTWYWDETNAAIQDVTGRNIRVTDCEGLVHLYEGNRRLFLDGTTNDEKDWQAQIDAYLVTPNDSFIGFVGEHPYPQPKVARLAAAWARGVDMRRLIDRKGWDEVILK